MATDSNNTFQACRKCGTEKPASPGYFRPYSAKNQRLRLVCRICEGYKTEGTYTPRGEKLSEEQIRENNARKCREYYAKNRDQILSRFRMDRAENPEKHREWDRRNSAKNKAAGSDYQKRRYAKRDKEKAAIELKKWKAENPDKVRAAWERTYAKHKDKHHARMIRWIKNNPQKVAIIRNRRRALEAGAVGDYTIEDVRSLLKNYGRFCFYCDQKLTKFHVDHFIPLARGGSNESGNLRLSCPTCNWSKGAKLPWEWRPDRFECDETG